MSCLLWFWSLFRRRKWPKVNPENPEDAGENVRNDGAQRAKRQSIKGKNWRRIFRKKKRHTEVEVQEEAGQSSAEQGPAGVQHPGAAELLPAPAENAENPAGGEEATSSVPDDQHQDDEVLKETEETEDEDVKELVNFLLNETEKQVELQEAKDQEVDSKHITELTENTLDQEVNRERITELTENTLDQEVNRERITELTENTLDQEVNRERITELTENTLDQEVDSERITELTENTLDQELDSKRITELTENTLDQEVNRERITELTENTLDQEVDSERITELTENTLDQEVDSERITELTENTLDDLEASCNELEDKLLKLMEEAEAAEARIKEWKREEAEAFAREEYDGLLVMRENITLSAGDRGLSVDERSRRIFTPIRYRSSLRLPRRARRKDGI
ncbi:uncharacterized protein LOC134323333 isoform X2 [Trichomycterus rosablanca]|uniref:uncharacterized protein LOC134323333 isoform X2 n=1 Tax=Trichomycterus rosablanca TaxID=2290929 RepID=UPI002F358A29